VRPLREVLREHEIAHIKHALELTGGHRTQTAELLGISRKVLWEKLRDFGIDPGPSDKDSEKDDGKDHDKDDAKDLPDAPDEK